MTEASSSRTAVAADIPLIFSGAFAISLIYVNYAYTGWNAATYITNEVDNPRRNLPLILVTGTVLVMGLYVLLNVAFLLGAPMDEMEGKIEIGLVVANTAFGASGGKIMGTLLSLMLISTVSAMVMAGPRVLQVIGEDFRIFGFLDRSIRPGASPGSVDSLDTDGQKSSSINQKMKALMAKVPFALQS